MLPVGTLYFYQAHVGRTVLPKWAIWAHLFYAVSAMFQSLGKHASARRVLHKPCFRQAHCFIQKPLRFLLAPRPPQNPLATPPHIWGFPRVLKVPEGHHLRGTNLREALRGSLPLLEASAGVSSRVLQEPREEFRSSEGLFAKMFASLGSGALSANVYC